MFGLGLGEGLLIAAIVILLFGAKRIPMLGKSLGQSMKSFKQGLKGTDQKDQDK